MPIKKDRPTFRRPNTLRQNPLFEVGEYEWIERCGIENMKGRVATAEALAKEASTTLTLVLAAIAGALAYGIRILSGEMSFTNVAAATACVWLMGVSAYLLIRCLRVTPIPAVYSQPRLLLARHEDGATYEECRHGELHNLEERIQMAVERNSRVSKNLNFARGLAAMTPFVAGFVVWISSTQSMGNPLLVLFR